MLLENIAIDFKTSRIEPMITEILTDQTKKLQNPTFRVCIEKGAIIENKDGGYETIKEALYDNTDCDEETVKRFLEYILAFK